MVNDAAELEALRALAPPGLPALGVMVETPAAALAPSGALPGMANKLPCCGRNWNHNAWCWT